MSTLLPYDMRPGAGAWGVVGGISGGIQNEVASLGGQFKLWSPVADKGLHQRGRSFEGNAWMAYAFNHHISGSAGVRWQSWDHLSGADPGLNMAEDPGNVGALLAGQRAMLPIGLNFLIPDGSRFAGNRLSVEAVYSMHHDYEGPQLGLDWGLNLGWTIGF